MNKLQANGLSKSALLLLLVVLAMFVIPVCLHAEDNNDSADPVEQPLYRPGYRSNRTLELKNGANSLSTAKYADNEIMEILFEKLESIRSGSIAIVGHRLGLAYEDKGTIQLCIEDATVAMAQAQAKGIQTAFRDTLDEGNMRIRLFTELIVNGITEVSQEITHEMTHAIMREKMGETPYIALPKWFREGSAVFAAGQGTERIDYVFAQTLPNDPAIVINGLEGKHSFDDYPEDYLAFEYISKTYGVEILKALIGSVVNDLVPYRDAIAQRLGVSYDEFDKLAGKYARKYAADWTAKDKSIPLFKDAITKYQAKLDTDALALFTKVAEQTLSPSLRNIAHYYAGRCCQKTGDMKGMASAFRIVVGTARYNGFADEALYYLITTEYYKYAKAPQLLNQESFAALERDFMTFCRDFTFSKFLPNVSYYFGHFYKKNNIFEYALEQFLFVTTNFPKTADAQGSWLNAGECAYSLGKYADAIEYGVKAQTGTYPKIADSAKELVERAKDKLNEKAGEKE